MMYRIKEQSDVYVDACIPDDAGQLLFLSAFGRDTSLQQMLARFQLRATEGGLDRLTIERDSEPFKVLVGDANRLDKLTGRLPRETLFGNLVHLWVFDPAALEPDRANLRGWIVADGRTAEADGRTQRRWSLVNRLSPIPLLDGWREPLLEALEGEYRAAWYEPGCVGRLYAERLALPEDFETLVSSLLRRGVLAAPSRESQQASQRSSEQRGAPAMH